VTGAAFSICYCRLERAKGAAIFESNADAGGMGSQAFLGVLQWMSSAAAAGASGR
jgi:hypothetical protein